MKILQSHWLFVDKIGDPWVKGQALSNMFTYSMRLEQCVKRQELHDLM